MLQVNIEKKDNQITIIKLKGHTLYDDLGKDIVCSAASSILITTVNAILEFDQSNLEVIETKDLVTVKVLKQNDIVNKLMINFENLIKELSTNYPENIKINERNIK